ncbi:MAG: glutamate--cysteine ligase [Sphingomonadales bacterium]|jgi:glutamate--cysteine ligase
MSTRVKSADDQASLAGKADLISYLARGSKPVENWRVGTEHEKFVYCRKSLKPVSYEEKGGIRDILNGLTQFGWQPVEEGGHVIALTSEGASVSLEPGGQLELSGAPLEDVHQTCREVGTHLEQIKHVSDVNEVGFLGMGFTPLATRADMPMMPKARYEIMKRYMPTKGNLGLDMMFRTCTIQVNLDFSSEADMVKKFRVGLALQPVATALFANSPFSEGKPNGYLSYRSHIWTDADPDRTGMLGFVFDEGMSFERYVDYALDVPMYFVYRDGKYINRAGYSFRDFMDGKLEGFEGQRPTLADWTDHLSTIFPEVRLKQFLEMRGADGGPWGRICALSALWVGLLYDGPTLDAAWDMVKDWSVEEQLELRKGVPKSGLRTPFRNGTVQDLALQMLELSDAGLKARRRQGASGETEQGFLATLWDSARSGKTPADRLLEAYNGPWNGDIRKVFEEASY